MRRGWPRGRITLAARQPNRCIMDRETSGGLRVGRGASASGGDIMKTQAADGEAFESGVSDR